MTKLDDLTPAVNGVPPVPREIYLRARRVSHAVIAAMLIDDSWQSLDLLLAYKAARPNATMAQHFVAKSISRDLITRILPDHKERFQKAAYAAALVAIVGELA